MERENNHMNSGAGGQSQNFFAGGTFKWKKSQREVWDELEAKIASAPKTRTLDFSSLKFISIAASLLLLIATGAFLRFYSTTITVPAGIHQVAELPDGSQVELNANSTLSYHPYWYRFNRELRFEGEAFFNVEKGKKFTVISASGKTRVLGTTFNIYSREEVYAVTCLTGSVRVTSRTKEQVVLKPNSKAEVQKDGQITVKHNIKTFPEISWRKNIFLFTATPVLKVFHEIERQYGVTIETDIRSQALYTGNFTKKQNVEDILGYVCPALGLRYTKKSTNLYVITLENE